MKENLLDRIRILQFSLVVRALENKRFAGLRNDAQWQADFAENTPRGIFRASPLNRCAMADFTPHRTAPFSPNCTSDRP
jgi:hypothetical protein